MNTAAVAEPFDVPVLGSGEAGKYLAWTLGVEGRRVALVERRYIEGSCPNIACLPSKNVVTPPRSPGTLEGSRLRD